MQHNIEYYPAYSTKKAIALVAHGLNMKPAGMLAIAQWLTAQGTDVYLVKLSGHFEEAVPITQITTTLWEAEMLHAYQVAKQAAIENAVPLYFVGYSLGALLGQVLIASKEARFDKQILMAPATAIRTRSYVIKWLFFLNKKWLLPSYTPSPYRANNFLPLAAYEVVFRNEKNIMKTRFDTLNIPTLLFIDPKDELISYKKLVHYARLFNLSNYQIITLDSNLKKRISKFHHLVVSEETMGKENWAMATAKMAAFLFEDR